MKKGDKMMITERHVPWEMVETVDGPVRKDAWMEQKCASMVANGRVAEVLPHPQGTGEIALWVDTVAGYKIPEEY